MKSLNLNKYTLKTYYNIIKAYYAGHLGDSPYEERFLGEVYERAVAVFDQPKMHSANDCLKEQSTTQLALAIITLAEQIEEFLPDLFTEEQIDRLFEEVQK